MACLKVVMVARTKDNKNRQTASHSKNGYKSTYHVKQPCCDFRVKLDLIPEEGTSGSSTRGTFSVICFPGERQMLAKITAKMVGTALCSFILLGF